MGCPAMRKQKKRELRESKRPPTWLSFYPCSHALVSSRPSLSPLLRFRSGPFARFVPAPSPRPLSPALTRSKTAIRRRGRAPALAARRSCAPGGGGRRRKSVFGCVWSKRPLEMAAELFGADAAAMSHLVRPNTDGERAPGRGQGGGGGRARRRRPSGRGVTSTPLSLATHPINSPPHRTPHTQHTQTRFTLHATPDFSVFVGDLAPDVTDFVLQETFRQYFPSVRSAKVGSAFSVLGCLSFWTG